MAKIHCFVRRFIQDKPFPFVTFTILKPFVKTIDALIDTGSPFTVLSPRDAIASRLPITKMRSGPSVGLAGHHFLNHPIKNVTIHFKAVEGESLEIVLPSLGVLVPTKIDEKIWREIKDIPTILGNYFLEDHGLSLHFNPRDRIAYLEIPKRHENEGPKTNNAIEVGALDGSGTQRSERKRGDE